MYDAYSKYTYEERQNKISCATDYIIYNVYYIIKFYQTFGKVTSLQLTIFIL